MFENEKESSPLVKMEDFKTWILYEDDHVLVLNKPGLACLPPFKKWPLVQFGWGHKGIPGSRINSFSQSFGPGNQWGCVTGEAQESCKLLAKRH